MSDENKKIGFKRIFVYHPWFMEMVKNVIDEGMSKRYSNIKLDPQ